MLTFTLSSHSRVKSMLEQRRILTSERKKASATLRLQKENVCKIMEVVRSDASKASRIISLAISGKLPLKDLASGNLMLRGASADNTRKRKGDFPLHHFSSWERETIVLLFCFESHMICDLRVAMSSFSSYITQSVLTYFHPVGMQVLSPSIACP